MTDPSTMTNTGGRSCRRCGGWVPDAAWTHSCYTAGPATDIQGDVVHAVTRYGDKRAAQAVADERRRIAQEVIARALLIGWSADHVDAVLAIVRGKQP